MKKNKLKFKKGFSIGEVILSVFILGVTMLTILAMYANSVKHFQDERDSVIASMLAQEGVELARNIRDNNWAGREGVLDTTPETFDNFNSSDSDNCRLDMDDSSISCGAGATNKVLYVDGDGFYVHGGGDATKFRRNISLDFDDATASDSEEVVVTSFVSWDNNNPETTISSCTVVNKCVFSQSTLTDWGTGT